jgi:predicted ATPase
MDEKTVPGRFSRIRLRNWRNFADCDVSLSGRVFLVGPNASGKSNFLEAFRFLRDLVALGGGLREAISLRGGVSALRCLAARRNPDVEIQVGVAIGLDNWEYTLAFHQDQQKRPQIKTERVTRNGKRLLDRPDRDDSLDPARLSQTNLEQVNVNREFRALADFFQSIRYLHIIPQLVREPDRSVGRRDDPYGGDFLEQLAKSPERTQKSRLRKIRDALRVAVPQLDEIELRRDARGTPHLRAKYQHWRPQGAWQTEQQFSDGTLRLMGLLWAVMDGKGPLLLEEPELSLHPEIVGRLPQMFFRALRRSGRQLFVSSHSPELLNDEGIGLNEALVLQPTREGTQVTQAADHEEIRQLLNGGIPLAEAVMPMTRPREAQRLTLFGDL